MAAIKDKLVTVTKLTTVGTEQEAALIVAALEEEGIQADYAGDTTASFRIGIPGSIQINIKSGDFSKAQDVLRKIQQADSLQEETEDIQEPSTWKFVCKLFVVVILVYICLVFLSDIFEILTGQL